MIADGFEFLKATHVFADGNEFHLGRDDALIGVPFLGDGMGLGFKGFAFEAGVFLEFVFGGFVLVVFLGVGVGEVAVVLGFDLATVVFLDIVAVENPLAAEGGETFADVAFEIGITPGAGAVVNTDGWILFDVAILMFGIGKANFAHGHLDGVVQFSIDIDAGGVGENGGVFGDGIEFGGVVDVFDKVACVVATLLGVLGSEVVFGRGLG